MKTAIVAVMKMIEIQEILKKRQARLCMLLLALAMNKMSFPQVLQIAPMRNKKKTVMKGGHEEREEG